MREYIKEGILKILYVRSEDNEADILTKNTSGNIFWKHVSGFMNYDEVPGYKEKFHPAGNKE